MKITIYKPSQLDKNIKATVHKTGKLGFTSDAAIKLRLSEIKNADFGENSEPVSESVGVPDTFLYMILYDREVSDSFKVSLAGDYYYVNTKILFDNLRIDYTKGDIIYDIEEVPMPNSMQGRGLYKLKQRTAKSKSSKKDSPEEDTKE